MDIDWHVEVEQYLIGRGCTVARREFDWVAIFDGGGSISLPVPWRIIDNGRIAFCDQDDGQKFGLPAPIDGPQRANELLSGKSVTKVSINQETSDLSICFGHATRLDTFNNSSGYEGWQVDFDVKQGGHSVVALGGGGLAVYNYRSPPTLVITKRD